MELLQPAAPANCADADPSDPIAGILSPRYLDEVGYFLYYEKEMRWNFDDYDEERRVYSQLHLYEVLEIAGEGEAWMRDKRVVNIGAGASCATLIWPCASKVSVDPLLGVYANLGMLLDDEEGTPATTLISASAERMPLVQDCCDLAYCRNALNHMHDPQAALREIARIVRPGGFFYLDVDLDGDPTPDEPVSLSRHEVLELLEPWFEVRSSEDELEPFSRHSPRRVRLFLVRNDSAVTELLDKQRLLDAYRVSIGLEPMRPEQD